MLGQLYLEGGMCNMFRDCVVGEDPFVIAEPAESSNLSQVDITTIHEPQNRYSGVMEERERVARDKKAESC
jgi:hypothetical protein